MRATKAQTNLHVSRKSLVKRRNHNTLSYKVNASSIFFFLFYKIRFRGFSDNIVETLMHIGGCEK